MFDQILELIKKYQSIVIFGHINPDGDCYGSQVGLKEVILANFPDKEVYISGTGVPRFYNIICKTDDVSDEVIERSLGILVDGNDFGRMEDSRVTKCAAWAKIDHHIDTGSFTQGPQVVDVGANSTCDIITGFVIDYNLKITKLAATALYLGILTDTARFQFVTDYPQTFGRVKFLCENGADPAEINEVLNRTDVIALAAKGYVLSHYKKSKHGVIYIAFNKKTLQKLSISANHASGLVNLLSNIDGYPVWCTFAEYTNGKVRMEIRSNGPIIQPVAVSVGGGGHAHASGATLPELKQDTIDDIIHKLDETILEWRGK